MAGVTSGALSEGAGTARDPLGGQPLRALVGVTATGKTELALALAERGSFEIVSLDSMLVYRGMDVGTAKPDRSARERVRHHVIDCADPPERYDVLRYLRDVEEAVRAIERRGARPLFVGGTGFYLKALTHGIFAGPPADLELRARLTRRARERGSRALHGELARLDPDAARRIHPNDERRVVRALEVLEQTGVALSAWQRQWRERGPRTGAVGPTGEGAPSGDGGEGTPAPGRPRRIVGLAVGVDELDERIAGRTRAMLEAGWVEEARAIRDGIGFGPTSIQALGYGEVLRHLDGELGRDELEATIALRTRQFARRQRTWFRKFADIQWVDAAERGGRDVERAVDQALAVLAGC